MKQQSLNKSNKKLSLDFKNVWFVLLINTKSGGGWGRCYLELKKQQYQFQYTKQSNTIIHVMLIDLFDQQKKLNQLNKIKILQENQQNSDVRVIICGGDGTIVWGIQECIKAGLDLQRITFGCLPIGTGNDFSRTIGWGGHPLRFYDHDILPLKKRVIQWLNSQIVKYDVWQVQIKTYQSGSISIVKNKQDFLLQEKKIHRGFVNYVGIGIDARVSYHFEKHRKQSKCMNLTVYGCFGLIFCCKNSPELSNSFQSFQSVTPGQTNMTQSSPGPMVMLQNSIQYLESQNIKLKQGYHGLVCLNSRSYMAGTMDVWETNNVGYKCKQKQEKVKFKKQQINDGLIEFIGFKNQLSLGLQRMLHSGGRVAQGQGPFYIKFKPQHKQQENYIQIDGEGLKIRGIEEIIIRKFNKIPTGSINVMYNRIYAN